VATASLAQLLPGGNVKRRIAFPRLLYAITIVSSFSLPTIVSGAPQIEIAPTNQTVMAGLRSQISVTAKGSSPLTYQWMFTRDGVTPRTVNIANATNSVLVLSNTPTNSAGFYSVKVTDVSGSVTTDYAHLRVLSLQPQTNNLIRLEVWNNVFGTHVRVQMTTNMVNTVANYYFSNAWSAQIVTGRDPPRMFFHATEVPRP
jgi:hypothetical protein